MQYSQIGYTVFFNINNKFYNFFKIPLFFELLCYNCYVP